MAKTKAAKAKLKKKDKAPKAAEDKVTKASKPSKTSFTKAKIAEKLAKKQIALDQEDVPKLEQDIPALMRNLLDPSVTPTDNKSAETIAVPTTITTTDNTPKPEYPVDSDDSSSSSSSSESDSDSDSSSAAGEQQPPAKKLKTDTETTTTTSETTSDAQQQPSGPRATADAHDESANRKARRRLQLIERQKGVIQKRWGVPEGSTEPHEGVEEALEEWVAKYDRTMAKVDWETDFRKRMMAAKRIPDHEERKAAIHELAQEKRQPYSGARLKVRVKKSNAERKASKKAKKAKKPKKAANTQKNKEKYGGRNTKE